MLNLRTFKTNKYSHLLFSILLFLIATPLIKKLGLPVPLIPLLFLAMMFFVLAVLKLKKYEFYFCLGAALVAFLLHVVVHVVPGLEERMATSLFLIGYCNYALFLMFSIKIILGRIFTEKQISDDTILGGIAVYFLIGFFWGLLYRILVLLNPEAIPGITSALRDIKPLYFSFMTLLTVGYGDIVPKSDMAMMLVILEAATGQFFLAIFVARLVGMRMSTKE